jgi:hypothetical protein
MDSGGNLFVADSGNNAIRVISKDGKVSTYAGTVDSIIPNLSILGPISLALDLFGNIFVAAGPRIYKIKNIMNTTATSILARQSTGNSVEATSSFAPEPTIIQTILLAQSTSSPNGLLRKINVIERLTVTSTVNVYPIPKSQSASFTVPTTVITQKLVTHSTPA